MSREGNARERILQKLIYLRFEWLNSSRLTCNCFFKKNIVFTVNIDICSCINFRGFIKMGNSTCIRTHVSSISDSFGYSKSNFQDLYIFANI